MAIAKTDASKLEAMREIIEKTVWDAVSYQGSLMYLSYAQNEGDGVCVTPAPTDPNPQQSAGTKAAWDVGAAMIIGDGYHSVLGRAQKRGVEFGTVGPAGISKAYEKIMKLLRDGQEEKTCNDPGSNEDLHEIYEKIEAQMRIVYCQSILKYAYKIDKELISNGSPKLDTVAEGQAMYRVIAGDIKAKARTVAEHFDSFFDINKVHRRDKWDFGNYCEALTQVKAFVDTISSHGVGHSDLGTYKGAAHVNCDLKTNDDPDHEIKSLAGSYYPSYLAYSSVSGAVATYEEALALGRNVAHVVTEMDSWIQHQKTDSSWNGITDDFIDDYKKWTETSTAQSNEWRSMKEYEFTDVAVGSQAGSKTASQTPLSDYLDAAVTLAMTDATYHESAKEMIEKTMLDAVGFHGALNLLNRAQDDASSPPRCVNGERKAQQSADWDTAAALIIGDGYHSVLGRAQKRGVEFGTMGTAHTAKTYEKIVKYLRFGQEEKNCDKLHDIYEGIEKQLRIVYSQCVVKYAYKIDAAIKAGTASTYGDDQSEGQALYRVIAGDVKRKGANTAYADAYQFFDTLFDVRATPSRGSWDFANYCKAIENLKGIFSISDSDFGHYHKAYHVHCESKKVYDSSSYAALVHEVYSTHAGMSKTETRTAEALAALSFIIAVAGVVVGSIALHKVRKTGATAFKNSYVVHNV